MLASPTDMTAACTAEVALVTVAGTATDSSKQADSPQQNRSVTENPDISCAGISTAAASGSAVDDTPVVAVVAAAQPAVAQDQPAVLAAKQHKNAHNTAQGTSSILKTDCKPTSNSRTAASKSRQKPVATGSTAGAAGAATSSNKTLACSKSSKSNSGVSATAAAASTALAAAKLGLHEQLATALAVAPAAAALRDVDGRCCLHYAAAYGHEECIDTLLAKGGVEAVRVRDKNGDLPLHLAAQKGQPMCAYNIAKACPASCLVKNKRGQTSIDLAATSARGEVLNALLLACAGEGKSTVAVAALRALLAAGAVPDTWAPNGSSALMLAAAADGVTALEVLLDNGATIELQDALGRSALMFAAGNNASAACRLLLDRSASLSARDRRGRAAIDYAAAGSEAAVLLQQRLEELEKVASQLQQQLLQEQGAGSKTSAAAAAAGESASATAAGSSSGVCSSSGKKKRKKKKLEGKGAHAGSNGVAHTAPVAVEECHGHDDDVLAASQDAPATEAAAILDYQPSRKQQQPPGAVAQRILGELVARDLQGGHCEQQQQQQQQQPMSKHPRPAPATIAAEVASAAEVAVEDADRAEGDWQVVLPKAKQRGIAAAPGSSTPSSSSSATAGAAARGNHSTARQLSHAPGCRQQQQQQPVGAQGSSSSSNVAITAKPDVLGLSSASCQLNPVNTLRHRRQGSSHSLCSTASMASYDSCCSSSAVGYAPAAGTPVSSCCSCVSCCSHHLQQQQQVQRSTAAWGGAAAASAAAAAAATAAAAAAKCKVSNSSSAACTPTSGHAGQPAELVHVAPGRGSNAQSTPAADDTGTVAESLAPAVEASSQPGFKAALLGPSNTVSPPSAADTTTAAAAGGSSASPPREASSGPKPVLGLLVGTTGTAVSPKPQQQHQQQRREQELEQQLQQAQAEVASLKQLLKQQAVSHQQDLASVLEDAAAHEAAAVSAAAQAAAAETLQSPLLRHLLAAAAQQAVVTERTRMQLRLQQLGLPPGAQLQLMLGPLAGLETFLGPAAAVAAAGAAAACMAQADPHFAAAAAATAAATSPCWRMSEGGGSSSGGSKGHDRKSFASILLALQQQQQQPRRLSAPDPTSDVSVPQLKLDLRSEYCGGGSSFVAPAKETSVDGTGSSSSRRQSTVEEVVGPAGQQAAAAAGDAGTPSFCSFDGEWNCKDDELFSFHDCGNSSRRCSSISGYLPDDPNTGCTAAATRTSSSSSLGLSTTDDAEVQEAHVGGFGAIGGPSSFHNSFGSPRSSYSGSKALSGSPAAAAGAGSSNITLSCSPPVGAAAVASSSLAGSPAAGSSQWVGRNFRNSLLGSSLGSFSGALNLPQVSQPATPVFASCCGSQFDTIAQEAPADMGTECMDPLEHQLVGGLLMDEDCMVSEKCLVSSTRAAAAAAACRSVVDMLPDQL